MDIRGSRVLLLGGSGLVGTAIAREILPHAPARLVVSGLTREEVEEAVHGLRGEPTAAGVEIVPAWGDIFLPRALKDRRRPELLADPAARAMILDDLYGDPAEDAVERNALGSLLLEHRPDVVVDCVNTATVFAYQNVFSSARGLRQQIAGGSVESEAVERLLSSLYLPQLIRHAQVALEAMRRVGTRTYLKIGTAGTGGMGLNIPFTHSEERPSRMLLAKSSVAGAHTLLLYLMARTPEAPAVKEIKPTAAISWKRVGVGEISRGRNPIRRIDSLRPLPVEQAFSPVPEAEPAWRDTGSNLRGVFLDAGENGLFSPAEFETLTALGLMEFITPEEIARDVVRELQGTPTGRDVVAALDASTSGPTYRAGVLRQSALARMDELERQEGCESVAYEMLGPPRLAKLLFEACILGRLTGGELGVARGLDPDQAARAADDLVQRDEDLRTRILSIGLPVLLADGARMLRGVDVKIRPESDADDRERLCDNGWVDLRPSNWSRWRARIEKLLEGTTGGTGADHGSRYDLEPWEMSQRIRPGALAAWIFRYEDEGERVKR